MKVKSPRCSKKGLTKSSKKGGVCMRNNRRLRQENQVGLPKYEQKACRKIINRLQQQGWNIGETDIYLDEDWGWIILADRQNTSEGMILRRIKPYQVRDKVQATLLQEKLRKDLVEVFPYMLEADKNRNTKVRLLKPTFNLS